MSRIRTIKPTFWTSAQIMECSPNARLMFIGIWNFCDDHGRHPASMKQLKALIFPGDDFSIETVRGMFAELAANDLITCYTVDNKEYFQVNGWQHQKIDKPQKPQFPGPFDERSEIVRDGREKEKEGNKKIPPSGGIVDADAPIDPIRIERERAKLAEDRGKLKDLGLAWNTLAGELRLPQIEEIEAGSRRERAALARIREGRDFNRAFAKIRASPFLRGDRGSTPCAFDWITNPTNFQKIIEGNYDEVRKDARSFGGYSAQR